MNAYVQGRQTRRRGARLFERRAAGAHQTQATGGFSGSRVFAAARSHSGFLVMI